MLGLLNCNGVKVGKHHSDGFVDGRWQMVVCTVNGFKNGKRGLKIDSGLRIGKWQ